ncbi:NRPS protein [Colletotrichum tofieldiae]|nr:NRPS protein [Colletotrichum tofieldiae]GKT68973.1 NRPS protein [Colletotrichum tofieldiae]
MLDTFDLTEDSLVHACFEKSVWFFVSILAINKAGCAWVPLDPSHPEQRQRQVVQQTQAKLALTSPTNRSICLGIMSQVLEVLSGLDQVLQRDASLRFDNTGTARALPRVSPRTASYVLFTSGSTGTSKGLVVEHEAVCTSQRCIGQRVDISPSTRMLQFASYVFDACIGEAVGTLTAGGCLCVPSEDERMNDISGFISRSSVNTALLTPSFIRTLRPADVPGLRVLMLPAKPTRLFNGWGPAETCVFSTLHEWRSVDESPRTVGKPVAGRCWIVEPSDSQRLVPIGCLGEVVIQGPTILREYLADTVRTAESTRTSPGWTPRHETARWDRIYRSGDLFYYNPDGTIEFASRKDTQVKIRGLRVELGEVEFGVRAALEGASQVVVDVFETDAGAVSLAAYFCFINDTRTTNKYNRNCSDMFVPLTEDMQRRINHVVGQLTVKLPRYMVPSLFIQCCYMPVITSTKIDRNMLRRYSLALSRENLARYSLQGHKKRAPETAIETQLQKYWAEVLQIPVDSISLDDSFLRIGGDSIAAIRLVALMRDGRIRLTVKDIFEDPRLCGMSERALTEADSEWYADKAEISSFSLLPESLRQAMEVEATDREGQTSGSSSSALTIRKQYSLSSSQVIEDAYPCTGLQEGFAALGIKQPGSYIGKYVYRLPPRVDLARFKKSWAQTVALCGNLRTRITFAAGPSVQVVIKDEFAWDKTEDCHLVDANNELRTIRMAEGLRLCWYGLVKDADVRSYFILAIHHAVYDGWTMRLVIDTMRHMYATDESPALTPYTRFIKYFTNMDGGRSASYWKTQLDGAKQATFPPIPRSVPSPADGKVTQVLRETVQLD